MPGSACSLQCPQDEPCTCTQGMLDYWCLNPHSRQISSRTSLCRSALPFGREPQQKEGRAQGSGGLSRDVLHQAPMSAHPIFLPPPSPGIPNLILANGTWFSSSRKTFLPETRDSPATHLSNQPCAFGTWLFSGLRTWCHPWGLCWQGTSTSDEMLTGQQLECLARESQHNIDPVCRALQLPLALERKVCHQTRMQPLQNLEKAGTRVSPVASRKKCSPAHTWILARETHVRLLISRTVRESMCVVLSL